MCTYCGLKWTQFYTVLLPPEASVDTLIKDLLTVCSCDFVSSMITVFLVDKRAFSRTAVHSWQNASSLLISNCLCLSVLILPFFAQQSFVKQRSINQSQLGTHDHFSYLKQLYKSDFKYSTFYFETNKSPDWFRFFSKPSLKSWRELHLLHSSTSFNSICDVLKFHETSRAEDLLCRCHMVRRSKAFTLVFRKQKNNKSLFPRVSYLALV